MLELLNIKFIHLIRSTRQNSDGESPVVLRLVYRTERRDLFTGLYCNPKEWDAQKGGMKGNSKLAIAFNQNLDLIVHKAHEAFQSLKFSGIPFSIDDLVNKIMGEEMPTTLLEFIEYGVDTK